MKNKSETYKDYQICGWRYVREETSFTVCARDEDEANELADAAIDMDDCDWWPDNMTVATETGFTVEGNDEK